MKTQCPHCSTQYDIDDNALDQARGTVVCSHCQGVFNAHQQAASDVDEDLWGFITPTDDNNDRNVRKQSLLDDLDQTLQAPRPAAADKKPELHEDIPAEMHKLRAEEVPPEFLAHYLPENRKSGAFLRFLGIMLLLLLGAAQLAWLYRQPLMRYPGFRHSIELVCATLGCQPAVDAPASFEIVKQRLRPYPEQKNAYILTTRLRNTAATRQPLPAIELALLDMQQKIIARRTLKAAQYSYNSAQRNQLPAGSSYDLKLILIYTGKPYSGYELKLIPVKT